MREGIIEYRHSIKSLEGMGSSSHDLGEDYSFKTCGGFKAFTLTTTIKICGGKTIVE